MATPYIGNANPPQIYADNVRDDLIPDPGTNKTIFDLSQEVPGGYEGNVTVIRRKFSKFDVIDSSALISFDAASSEIRCSNAIASAILDRLQVGNSIIVAGAANSNNNGTFLIAYVNYSDPNIAIGVTHTLTDESVGAAISIKQGIDGPWETLEPEIDYNIIGSGPSTYNKQIQMSEILQEEDMCYVIHRASATYNLVPSPNSVGPDQLQTNLRDFLVERFVGTGAVTTFTLSRLPANARAIIVTVNGLEQDDDDLAFPNTRDYTVNGSSLIFRVAPALNAKIRVQHLGFSTVSRRASLSSGQVANIPSNSVGTTNLVDGSVTEQKLSSAPAAVSTSRIQDAAVTGQKILLANEETLKATKSGGGTQALLRLNAANQTILSALAQMVWEFAGTTKGTFTANTIEPELTNDISLGTLTKKFKDMFLSGDANIAGQVVAASANISGNIAVSGTVDGVDVSNLQTTVNDLSVLLPAGTIIQYAGTITPTPPTGWLVCDGSTVATASYPALSSVLSTRYNTGGEGVGMFRLPNFKLRFPIGVADSGHGFASVLGGSDGVWDHSHGMLHTHTVSATGALPNHTHDTGTLAVTVPSGHVHDLNSHVHTLGNHAHTIPAHFHRVGQTAINNGNGVSMSIHGGNHGHGYIDPGHSHSIPDHRHGISGRSGGSVGSNSNKPVEGSATSGSDTTFNTGYKTGLDTNSAGIGGLTINWTTHDHPDAEITGTVGRAGVDGDAVGGMSSGANNNNTGVASGNTGAGPSINATVSGTIGATVPVTNIISSGSTGSSIANTDTNNPPYLAVYFLIKT